MRTVKYHVSHRVDDKIYDEAWRDCRAGTNEKVWTEIFRVIRATRYDQVGTHILKHLEGTIR